MFHSAAAQVPESRGETEKLRLRPDWAVHMSRTGTGGRAAAKGSTRHIGDFVDFGLQPISWNHTVPHVTRSVVPGFAGHITDARIHYGSSHYVGVPLRGGGRTPLPHKGGLPTNEITDPSKLDTSQGLMTHDAVLHISSSQVIGRNAWNLRHARTMFPNPDPTPRTADRRERVARQVTAMRSANPNLGRPGTAWSLRRKGQYAEGAASPAEADAEEPIPSFRQSTTTPMSRDPRGPSAAYAYSKGGVKPRYTGHIPGVYNHYGSTHVGGSFTNLASEALPGRTKTAWEESGRSDLQA